VPATLVDELRGWLTPAHGPGTSAFATHVQAASARWQQTVETLGHRRTAIEKLLPDLAAKAGSPAATADDVRAERSAQTALQGERSPAEPGPRRGRSPRQRCAGRSRPGPAQGRSGPTARVACYDM
jgi:hypothetical protein